MRLNQSKNGKLSMRFEPVFTGLALAAVLMAGSALAGAQETNAKPAEPKLGPSVYETFYLTNLTQQNDLNDIQTNLRNMLPNARIYGTPSQQAISVRATPEDMTLARKIVSEFDRPRKSYRLTYTLTETDGGKRVATRSFSLVVVPGYRTALLKQGNRIPLVTGKSDTGASGEQSQVQYIDVGLNIEATLEGASNASGDVLRLRTKVEQSSLAEDKSGLGAQDPVIRQATIEGNSGLVPGKPVVLGAMDVPGSTRHDEVEVVAELVK
jgi:type II secretory pathway component GspD/PulD (secretin)